MLSRIEKDEFGEMEIPLNAYYGIKTLRSKENFTVTKIKIHKQMIKSLAIVKKACALASYDAGYINITKIKAIANACDEVINGRFNNQFITDAIQGASCMAFNNNMNEVIANRANEILGGELGKYPYISLDDVNLFQASNDVIPTAAKNSMLVLAKPLIVEMKKMFKTFQDKAKKYNNYFKIGRTHLQDSLPISFGQLFASVAANITRDTKRLEAALEDMTYVNLGTGNFGVRYYCDDKYVESILKRFNEFTEITFKYPESTLDNSRNLDSFVTLSHVLKLIAINLSKTASDIRLMASGPNFGFNEITLPEYERLEGLNYGQKTQSIPEIVNQVCFQIIGKDTTITYAAEHGEMEVNSFASIIYPNLFDCLEYLTRAIKLFREYCVEGITINKEECEKEINASHGVIVGLLGKVDYNVCVEVIKKACNEHKTIKEVCLEMNLMSEAKLDKNLDIKNFKIK